MVVNINMIIAVINWNDETRFNIDNFINLPFYIQHSKNVEVFRSFFTKDMIKDMKYNIPGYIECNFIMPDEVYDKLPDGAYNLYMNDYYFTPNYQPNTLISHTLDADGDIYYDFYWMGYYLEPYLHINNKSFDLVNLLEPFRYDEAKLYYYKDNMFNTEDQYIDLYKDLYSLPYVPVNKRLTIKTEIELGNLNPREHFDTIVTVINRSEIYFSNPEMERWDLNYIKRDYNDNVNIKAFKEWLDSGYFDYPRSFKLSLVLKNMGYTGDEKTAIKKVKYCNNTVNKQQLQIAIHEDEELYQFNINRIINHNDSRDGIINCSFLEEDNYDGY